MFSRQSSLLYPGRASFSKGSNIGRPKARDSLSCVTLWTWGSLVLSNPKPPRRLVALAHAKWDKEKVSMGVSMAFAGFLFLFFYCFGMLLWHAGVLVP